MMENRSFDNVFGYLYDANQRNFSGAAGHWNKDPNTAQRIYTSPTATPHTPFPDPGEYMGNVLLQMFGEAFDGVNYNPVCTPTMDGFVSDYSAVLQDLTMVPPPFTWFGNPAETATQIMQCQSVETLPVLYKLAREFAIFDHWFCALPSATWPNRAFWHADTSYGFADNPSKKEGWKMLDWSLASDCETLFDQLDKRFSNCDRNWTIYSDQLIPLTKFIHFGSMFDNWSTNNFRKLEYAKSGTSTFFDDCLNGALPKYSFIEPHFLDYVDHGQWHNDMHPSKFLSAPHWILWGPGGPGSITLGDQLLLKVYEAIRRSPLRDRVLFVLAFDEHGGCYDHVPPGTAPPPSESTYYGGNREYDFDFTQLGPRVPMMMVSSFIPSQTIVSAELNHASFLAAMQQKWGLDALGPRQASAVSFAQEVPMTDGPREWEDLSGMHLDLPEMNDEQKQQVRENEDPLNDLQASYFRAVRELGLVEGSSVETTKDAHQVLDVLHETYR